MTACGVRPVRLDQRTAGLRRWICSRPLMALAKVIKYASSNNASHTVQHATDLVFEIGVAIGPDSTTYSAALPLGLLYEAADLIEQIDEHIKADGWSVCP
ncbi:hypothetical protein GCM10010495_48400 [Kitasatospora herbaricolor]|uniref:hypothetical protein n=1 Tax=Kitasatospora herbaricolor TaxID=68217 RepID=UPI00174D314B|nr:hypothetical protein [Kitasatospora herbaricolor]MDQ0305793.1 hypothetical protein [Kitasatospora herbaricolor]GGV26789.1 hypothetical protein GCM10010495_48400 [Kitasatospora herbaricolor]